MESVENSPPQNSEVSPQTASGNKMKKRSRIERQLETNLTAKITSPVSGDSPNTSRYGRARRLKSTSDYSDVSDVIINKVLKLSKLECDKEKNQSQPDITSEIQKIQSTSPVKRMHASNSSLTPSPSKNILQCPLKDVIDHIYNENKSLSRFGKDESVISVQSADKIYVRKDLIQRKDENDPSSCIRSVLSPTRSPYKSSMSQHLNNILERSAEKYNLPEALNRVIDNSSVAKVLDFGPDKKQAETKSSKHSITENSDASVNNMETINAAETSSELEAFSEHEVGDLAWARVGAYPFWPCILTREPYSDNFVKKKALGRGVRLIYHVTFFGDNGRRGWITDNMLRKYLGLREFENTRDQFTPEDRKKDPKLYNAFCISEKKNTKWKIAVDEAELLFAEPKSLRLDILNNMLLVKIKNANSTPKKGSKPNRKYSDVSLSESLYDSLFSEDDTKTDDPDHSKKSGKKSVDVSEIVTACLDVISAKTGMTMIQKQSHMDKWLQKAKFSTPIKKRNRSLKHSKFKTVSNMKNRPNVNTNTKKTMFKKRDVNVSNSVKSANNNKKYSHNLTKDSDERAYVNPELTAKNNTNTISYKEKNCDLNIVSENETIMVPDENMETSDIQISPTSDTQNFFKGNTKDSKINDVSDIAHNNTNGIDENHMKNGVISIIKSSQNNTKEKIVTDNNSSEIVNNMTISNMNYKENSANGYEDNINKNCIIKLDDKSDANIINDVDCDMTEPKIIDIDCYNGNDNEVSHNSDSLKDSSNHVKTNEANNLESYQTMDFEIIDSVTLSSNTSSKLNISTIKNDDFELAQNDTNLKDEIVSIQNSEISDLNSVADYINNINEIKTANDFSEIVNGVDVCKINPNESNLNSYDDNKDENCTIIEKSIDVECVPNIVNSVDYGKTESKIKDIDCSNGNAKVIASHDNSHSNDTINITKEKGSDLKSFAIMDFDIIVERMKYSPDTYNKLSVSKNIDIDFIENSSNSDNDVVPINDSDTSNLNSSNNTENMSSTVIAENNDEIINEKREKSPIVQLNTTNIISNNSETTIGECSDSDNQDAKTIEHGSSEQEGESSNVTSDSEVEKNSASKMDTFQKEHANVIKNAKGISYEDEFLKFVELRRDAILDEHADVSESDIMSYLYETWSYEQKFKSDEMKIDDIEQSNIVKGLKKEETITKPQRKVKKKTKLERGYGNDAFESVAQKEKATRKRVVVKPFYNETDDFSDSDESVTKDNKTDAQKAMVNGVEDNEEMKAEEVEQPAYEICEYDERQYYLAQLTKPKPNVFKGLIRERVCDICEKPNGLVKCKGPCAGFYHERCDERQLLPASDNTTVKGRKKKNKPRGRKPKNSNELNDSDGNNIDKSQDMSIDEPKEIETPNIVPNIEDFEDQHAAKMKEILEKEQKLYPDSDYTTDEELDWNTTVAGQCEIVDFKLKPRIENISQYANYKCNNCKKYETPLCFVCKSLTSPKNSEDHRQKCNVTHCHKYFHLECLEHWPQARFSSGELSKSSTSKGFEACPRHVCHTCVSDDPRGCKTRFSGDKLAKCVRCPAVYHSFTKCLPAGTQILTASHIICPRHHENRPGKVPCHVNTGWCFICALGGTLICCEYCPTSFHAECLNIKPPEGGYMCEDCETGRLPLYGEMVWVKLGHYRWWPGLILHPSEIPLNVLAIKHSPGEFVVRFFGQYDHYWVNRGRVFPFQEGDTGKVSSQKSKIDAAFTEAMEDAQKACAILKEAESLEQESAEIASSLLPPHYVRLKVNRPSGALVARDCAELALCDCSPHSDTPCGPDSQCLNRVVSTECGPFCRAGERCNNRAFEKRLYPKLIPYRTPHRGWGLRTLEDIKKGQFVIEYVGELIDMEEFRRRMQRKHEIRDENFYFLTLDKDRMIDAGPKGNLARFMNHSCEPNCVTQKWTVLGDDRVGLFAIDDIPANTEVTFNYNLESVGIEKKQCMCGAKRCSGYIGAKPKQEEGSKKQKPQTKRVYKKRNASAESPSASHQQKAKAKATKQEKIPPRELTGIEEDLFIIKNGLNGATSDSENDRMAEGRDEKENSRNVNGRLKRKMVRFSTEDTVYSDDAKSPVIKRSKTSNGVSNFSMEFILNGKNSH